MGPVGGKGLEVGDGGVGDRAVGELGEGENIASVVGEESSEAVAVEGRVLRDDGGVGEGVVG